MPFPVAISLQAGALPSDCLHIHRATRPNGDRAILAFTSNEIYKWRGEISGKETVTAEYKDSPDVLTIDIVGVPGDMPINYLEGAYVFWGNVFIGIARSNLEVFNNGNDFETRVEMDRAISINNTADVALSFVFTAGSGWEIIGSGFSATDYWEALDIDGRVVVNNGNDLPHVWDWENTIRPLYELREQGVGKVGTIWTAWDFLFLADVSEIEATKLTEWMNGDDPYGVVTDDYLAVTPYRVIWSDRAVEWGLNLQVSLTAGSNEITLPYECLSFSIGDTLNFTETVEDGDGNTVFLNEVEIIGIDGAKIYISENAPHDSTGSLFRTSASSRIIGYDDLQGDGSPLIRGGTIGKYIYILRESAIILGQITDSVAAPFVFQEVYRGILAPTTKKLNVIIENTLMYYSRSGWYQFDLQSQRPKRIQAFDINDALFQINEKLDFIQHNPTDEEFWICMRDRVVVFDYKNSLLAELDYSFNAAGIVDDPNDTEGSVDRILLLSNGPNVYRFNPEVFTRDGQPYVGLIEYGWTGDKGRMRDTVFRRYIPVGTGPVSIDLIKNRSGSDTIEPIVQGKEIGLGVALQLYSRGQWIGDKVSISDGETRLLGREIEAYTTQNRVRGLS